jgi:Flp pilus assembly protein TadG
MPQRARVRLRRLKPADQRGVALVEFALVLPLILLLLLGMIDVGKALNYWNDETHLANEAARYAVVNNNPGPDPTLNDSIRRQADSSELRNGGTSSIASPGIKICFWFPKPDGHTATDPTNHLKGDPVEVVVKADYNWLAYLVGRGVRAHSTITATSRMRLEKDYPATPGSNAFTTGTTNNNDGTGTC